MRWCGAAASELYPDVVDRVDLKGGVPSRLMKTDRHEAEKGRHAVADVRKLPVGGDEGEIGAALEELAREGARRMIAAALEVRYHAGSTHSGLTGPVG